MNTIRCEKEWFGDLKIFAPNPMGQGEQVLSVTAYSQFRGWLLSFFYCGDWEIKAIRVTDAPDSPVYYVDKKSYEAMVNKAVGLGADRDTPILSKALELLLQKKPQNVKLVKKKNIHPSNSKTEKKPTPQSKSVHAEKAVQQDKLSDKEKIEKIGEYKTFLHKSAKNFGSHTQILRLSEEKSFRREAKEILDTIKDKPSIAQEKDLQEWVSTQAKERSETLKVTNREEAIYVALLISDEGGRTLELDGMQRTINTLNSKIDKYNLSNPPPPPKAKEGMFGQWQGIDINLDGSIKKDSVLCDITYYKDLAETPTLIPVKSVTLSNFPNLTKFERVKAPEMSLINCPSLKTLSTLDVGFGGLTLNGCSSLVEIDNTRVTGGIQISNCPKLKSKKTHTPWISDHLCWGRLPGAYFHDLLPLPYTKEVINYVAERAKIVQDFLEVPFALENLSSYASYQSSEMPEWEFYTAIVEKADIFMMLDVNNIYVSSRNHGFQPSEYYNSLPEDRILQIHLAGHKNFGDYIIDTHDDYVCDEVWEIYREIYPRTGGVSTLLEWDSSFISFQHTWEEALKAKQFQSELGTSKASFKKVMKKKRELATQQV